MEEMKITIKEGGSKKREPKKKTKTVRNVLSSLSGLGLKDLGKMFSLLALFGLPLFFGLGKIGNLDFTKQAFLTGTSFLALSFWFIHNLSRGRVEINFSLLSVVSFVFILTVAASTIFSVWRWGSFWGWPQQVKENFLALLSLFVFYFSFSHLFSKKEVSVATTCLLAGGVVAGAIGILQVAHVFVLPLAFTRNTGFNTIGSHSRWAAFMGALIPLCLSLLFSSKNKGVKTLSLLALILFSSGLIITNNKAAWLGLFIAMAAYITFLLWKTGTGKQYLLLAPAILFCVSLGFGVLNIRLPNIVQTPVEVKPSLRATFRVGLNMLKRSPKSWILGWGPGTFKYGWSKFKNAGVNRTLFWNTRFTRGGSEIVERLGTLGLAGVFLNFLLFALGLGAGIKALTESEKGGGAGWLLTIGVLSSFVFLSVLKVLSTHNLVLEFAWWAMLAGLTVLASTQKKRFELTAESKASFVFSFFGIILLTGGVFLFYLEGARYVSEIRYAEALTANQLEKTEMKLGKAINLNPQQESFWRGLADYYLARTNRAVAEKTDTKQAKKRKNEQLTRLVANAVSASKRAVDINPENVANWQKRGNIYAQMIGLSNGAFDWAVKSYRKALALEPNNPYLLVQLGKAYLNQARITKDKKEKTALLDKSEKSIRKALAQKRNYAPAAYQMASLFRLQGKTKETINVLESIKRANPAVLGYDPMQDTRLAFQLGVLYFNQGNFDKAQKELERAASLSPKYSNARFLLGLTYDQQGRKQKAIKEFEAIKQINPENERVNNILSNLRAGKPARAKKEAPEEKGEQLPEELPIQEEPKEK